MRALPLARLSLSPAGARFIADFEGFVARPYNDAAGNATIGYGHLLHYGNVTSRDDAAYPHGISHFDALLLLRRDAARFETVLRGAIRVPLVQAQFDALVSFVYNVGPGGVLNTHVQSAVNARPQLLPLRPIWKRRVHDALVQWDRAGGQVLQGLLRRREAEAHLFASGRYS